MHYNERFRYISCYIKHGYKYSQKATEFVQVETQPKLKILRFWYQAVLVHINVSNVSMYSCKFFEVFLVNHQIKNLIYILW